MEYLIGAGIGVFAVLYVFYQIGKNVDDTPDPKITFRITRGGDDDDDYDDYEPRYRGDPPPVKKYWDEIEWVPVKANLQMSYTNAKGEVSKRTVQIPGYDGSPYLNGFCKLRGEERTFRVDRINEAVDANTGEVINSVPDHLLQKYHASPDYILSEIFSNHLDIIKVLFYMGKADGQLRAAERSIICSTIRSLAKGKKLTDKDINRHLNQLAIPSLHAFKLAFGRVCKTYPRQTPKIYAIAKKIVDTQKTVHVSESEALDYMIKKMGKDGIETSMLLK